MTLLTDYCSSAKVYLLTSPAKLYPLTCTVARQNLPFD